MNAAEPSIIPFQRPSMPSQQRIEHHFAHARRARYYSNSGPCARRLCAALADRVGTPCVVSSSATSGLAAAIGAAVRPSEAPILIPGFTFVATAQAVLAAGFEPQLVDVDPAHWHLDPTALMRAIEQRRPAAVVAVTTFGTPPPRSVSKAWSDLCEAAGVPLIVDSAAGFGGVDDRGCPIGANGDVEVVSFHATKPFAIGEGGAVFSADEELLGRITRLLNFGFDAQRQVQEVRGFNGKMSEIHAAIGLAALEDFDTALERRRASVRRVTKDRPELSLQDGHERSTWQFLPVAYRDQAAAVAAEARASGIVETRRYYEPLHRFPAFGEIVRHTMDTTEDLAGRIVCFPMAADLTPREEDAISRALS